MIFLLKITITPILVAFMSLVARRWGPRIGGIIMGMPWMTGPILFFLGIEHGEAYAARTSVGVLIGTIGIAGYVLAYAYTARRASWPFSIAAAFVTYAVVGSAVSGLALSLWTAAIAGFACLCGAYLLMPKVSDPGGLRFLPWWDIPMRMLATAVLISIITISAEYLGPELSGVVATYPVILSVISVFTHWQWGWPALVQLIRGTTLSLLSFVAFFLVVGLSAETVGLTWSFVLACISALAGNSIVILAGARNSRIRATETKSAE